MFQLSLGKDPSYIVGVDIGSSSVKVIGMRMGKAPALTLYSILEYSPDSKDGQVSEFLNRLLKDKGVSSKDAVLVFSGEYIVFKKSELPAMPAGEIANALKWKEKETINFNIDDAYLGYELLRQRQKEDGSKLMDFILAVVSKEAMEKKMEALKSAGLEVMAIGTYPMGLGNILKMDKDIDETRAAMIIDIGFERSEISIFKKKALEFIRAIPIGSNSISAAMEEPLASESGEEVKYSKDEAEKIKRDIGIAYDESTLDRGVGSVQVLSIMRPVLEQFLKEIRRSVEYYMHEYGETNEAISIYLTGGGARLKNLDRYLQEELNLPVKKMEIPKSVDVSQAALKGDDHLSIISLIGAVTGYKHCLNILPRKYKLEKIEFLEKVVLRMSAVILAIILGASFTFIKLEIKDYANRLKNLPVQKDFLSNVKDLQTRVLEREGLLSAARGSNLNSIDYIMKELSNIVPGGIVLNSLAINTRERTLDMAGAFHGPRTSAELVITKFMEELERSKYFKEAQLSSIQGQTSDRDTVSSFGVSCLLE